MSYQQDVVNIPPESGITRKYPHDLTYLGVVQGSSGLACGHLI